MEKKKLIKNKVQCKNCKDIIESKFQHDWVCCSCFLKPGNHGFYLDGGLEYIRMGGNIDDVIDLREYK